MTEKEAGEILDWLTGCFGKRLDQNERLVWLTTLVAMDAGKAMEMALQFGKDGDRFPSIPDFRRAVRGHTDREYRSPDPTDSIPRSKPPFWVFRWIPARFLYARFDKEQDMRRFGEQGDWADPLLDVMPENEWVAEAHQVSEAEVWATVNSGPIIQDPGEEKTT